MNNLPPEILEIIFYPLHQLDKVECMTVCRSWKRVLETTTLCQVVRLQSTSQLNKLIKKMEQEPYQRQKVERLIIDAPHMLLVAIDQLPFFFSNVKKIVLCNNIYAMDRALERLLPFYTWRTTIEYIHDDTGHGLAYNIIKGGVCPVLTEINISGKYLFDGNKFIPLLQNAPALRSLAVYGSRLTLHGMELLHEAAPLLSSLSLSFDFKHLSFNIIPTEIKPADSVTRLIVDAVGSYLTREHIAFLKYLSKKYTQITDMTYCFSDRFYNIALKDSMTMRLVPHIKQIAPHLIALKVQGPQYLQYIIPELDLSNCQLKELVVDEHINVPQMDLIALSDQARFIQKLTLALQSSDLTMPHLTNFTALTEFNLIYKLANVDLEKALDTICLLEESTLVTLTLENVATKFNPQSTQQCHSLKTLVLKETDIADNLGLFVNRAFPNLRTLIIDGCKIMPGSFYLADSNLSHLELRASLPPENQHVLVVTIDNNEKRWYSAHSISKKNRYYSDQLAESPAVKTLPYEAYNGSPYATFVCKSLYSFFLVNNSD